MDNKIKQKMLKKYEEISNQFTIDSLVKCVSDSYEDIPNGSKGRLLKNTFNEHGCDLRVYFEDLDIETWIDAEDMSPIENF